MAEKIVIEIFKEKKAEEFTSSIASPDCRANAGSAAALTASMAAALTERAAKLCADANEGNDRLAYIVKNAEILRG